MSDLRNNNSKIKFMLAGFVVVAIAVGLWWMNTGYGEVSPRSYQFSKALYSACQAKNDAHLAKAEEMLAKDAESLPANELRWLNSIVAMARDGNWESAAANARRMMEDQVQY